MSWLIDHLNEVPLASLMLVITCGYLLGRLSWRGMSIGPAGGTLAFAIAMGALGLSLSFRKLYGTENPVLTVGWFGFVLFIYSVGFEAGPRFFSVLRGGRGWRFVAVGTVVNLIALVSAVALGYAFELGGAETAGLLSGALTSPPTYAAAAELFLEDPAHLERLAVSFAVTYPVGLLVVVLLIQFLPRLMGDDLSVEAVDDGEPSGEGRPVGAELVRAFDVTEQAVDGQSLSELDLNHKTGCFLTLVHRGHEIFVPTAQTTLKCGDHVLAKGRLDGLQRLARVIGAEVYDDELRNRMPPPHIVRVLSGDAIGKSISELHIARRFGVLVVGIRRGDVALQLHSDTVLERADLLEVVGRRDDVRNAAALVGRAVRPSNETDIAVYALGIFFGLVIGKLSVDVFEFPITLGFAGGLLIAGVLMGRFRHLGPFDTNVPRPARQLVRDLGILLFVGETGVKAGQGGLGTYSDMLVPTLTISLVVTALSVLGAVWFGRRILRMSAVDTWGSVGGGMTSSSALVAVKRAADSDAPALSYAAAYAVASVIVTLLGRIVIHVMS